MIKKLVLLLSFTSVLFAATAAQISASDISANPSEEQIDQYIEIYNNNTEEVPGIVKTIVGDQKVNLNYENETYGLEMDNMEIAEVNESFNQSSLEIWIDRQDIVEVANADDPKKELTTKIENEEIRYEEHGLVNKIKFGLARISQKLGFL